MGIKGKGLAGIIHPSHLWPDHEQHNVRLTGVCGVHYLQRAHNVICSKVHKC